MKLDTMANKIGFSFMVLCLALVLIIGFTLYQLNNGNQATQQTLEQKVPFLISSFQLKSQLNHSMSMLRGWVSLGDEYYYAQINSVWKDIDNLILDLDALLASLQDEQTNFQFDNIKINLDLLRQYQQKVQAIAHTADNQPGWKTLTGQAMPHGEKTIHHITEMIELGAITQNTQIELLKYMADYRASMVGSLSNLRAFMLTADESFRQRYFLLWETNATAFIKLTRNSQRLTEAQQLHFSLLTQHRKAYEAFPENLMAHRTTSKWDQAIHWLTQDIQPLERKINIALDTMVNAHGKKLLGASGELQVKHSNQMLLSILLCFVATAMLLVTAYYLIKTITSPFKQATNIANELGKGNFNFDIHIESNHEFRQLAQALTSIKQLLINVTNLAYHIANGKYQQGFPTSSHNSQVAGAMQAMTEKLRLSIELNSRDSWIKAGQAGLSECLNGQLDETSLAKNTVRYICDYYPAQIGALYLPYNGHFQLMASYAFDHSNNAKTTFKLGEGLVGQAAIEQKCLHYTIPPSDDGISDIHLGLGQFKPTNVLIAPMLNRQAESTEVVGILVLGSLSPFSPDHTELLEKQMDLVAIALKAASSRQRLEDLLAESKQQAEELQLQQESLRLSNAALANQKQQLQDKNDEVEQARQAFELKAKELEQTGKYKSEFLANMSHELRTPLNALLILSESLASNDSGNLNSTQIEDLQVILRSGKTLLTLIDDILDLAKVESGKLDVQYSLIQPQAIIKQLEVEFKPMVLNNKALTITSNIIPDTPKYIQTDPYRLSQVLRNLISNAVKFTEQGTITLTYDYARHSPDYVCFVVEDTGIGITEQQQQHIFEPFQQADGSTSRKYGGTGLGLSISRELSKLLGGTLEVNSELGKGSEFILELPITPGEELPHQLIRQQQFEIAVQSPDPITKSSSTPFVLLLLDSSPLLGQVIELLKLNQLNYITAKSSKEIADALRNGLPQGIIVHANSRNHDNQLSSDLLTCDCRLSSIATFTIEQPDNISTRLKREKIEVLNTQIDEGQLQIVFDRFELLLNSKIERVLIISALDLDNQWFAKMFRNHQVSLIHADMSDSAYQLLMNERFCALVLIDENDYRNVVDWLAKADLYEATLPPTLVIAPGIDDTQRQEIIQCANYFELSEQDTLRYIQNEIKLFLHTLTPESDKEKVHSETPCVSELLNGKRILVVDDDLRNTYALSRVLKSYQLEVIIADNGQLALEKLSQNPDVDLILMDIMMPVMDGYETIKHIRHHFQYHYPIIALTAKTITVDKDKCLRSGADDYITKPLDIQQLVELVKLWVQK